MRRPVDFSLPLSIEDAHLLLGALTGYVEDWKRHYDEDAGQTHTPEEWEALRTETGHLIWRVEELAVREGQNLSHSQWAVRPADDGGDDDGGTGVREPRRPKPTAPSTAEEAGG